MIFLWFICFFSFLKLEELELWVPWMLPWDKVHMFLWQGTFRRTATTFTKKTSLSPFIYKKNQQGVLLRHFLYMAMQDQRVMYLGPSSIYDEQLIL